MTNMVHIRGVIGGNKWTSNICDVHSAPRLHTECVLRKMALKNESNYFCSSDVSKALQSFRYLWWCRARKWITCSGSKCLLSFTTTSSQSQVFSFSTTSLCSSHFPLCVLSASEIFSTSYTKDGNHHWPHDTLLSRYFQFISCGYSWRNPSSTFLLLDFTGFIQCSATKYTVPTCVVFCWAQAGPSLQN